MLANIFTKRTVVYAVTSSTYYMTPTSFDNYISPMWWRHHYAWHIVTSNPLNSMSHKFYWFWSAVVLCFQLIKRTKLQLPTVLDWWQVLQYQLSRSSEETTGWSFKSRNLKASLTGRNNRQMNKTQWPDRPSLVFHSKQTNSTLKQSVNRL